ncbi:hypothetical protein NC651_013176 [Populus alba x Populus x berolinensis]|nr:hypothetical protein NC651_013171 [Populus alba x Populus x berolinensis]KAJ6919135.1 hypothetical protein NC651_013176 [Populus alba x Populus x berolinensis]
MTSCLMPTEVHNYLRSTNSVTDSPQSHLENNV